MDPNLSAPQPEATEPYDDTVPDWGSDLEQHTPKANGHWTP